MFCAPDVTLPKTGAGSFHFPTKRLYSLKVDGTAQAVNEEIIWPQMYKITNVACNHLKQYIKTWNTKNFL